jgi:hypothetical protein
MPPLALVADYCRLIPLPKATGRRAADKLNSANSRLVGGGTYCVVPPFCSDSYGGLHPDRGLRFGCSSVVGHKRSCGYQAQRTLVFASAFAWRHSPPVDATPGNQVALCPPEQRLRYRPFRLQTDQLFGSRQSEYSSMLTRADDIKPLPENVLNLSVSRRAWNGMSVDVTESRCSGMVAHQFPHETETRLIALLEEVGSPCEPRLRENQPCPDTWTSPLRAWRCGATA